MSSNRLPSWSISKKNLPRRLTILKALYTDPDEPRPLRYWCGDESRFGLHTLPRRRITARGVKPIGPMQWNFQAYYLYGLVEPATGDHFLLEFSHADSVCFQLFLAHFAARYPHELHVLQFDQASFHLAKNLSIPENVIMLYQPPKCPELNPVERFWQHLKETLSWAVVDSLDELRAILDHRLRQLTPTVVASLTGFDFIINALKFAYFY
jgi:hypothetical protein